MTLSTALDTLLISLGAWLLGGTVGGALGTLIAVRARAMFTAVPHLRRLSILLPGRTIVLNLLIITWTPASFVLIGLRPLSGLVNTGLEIFLFALLITVSLLFEQWYSSPFAVRIIAGLRTLATTSLAVAAFLSDFHGIGWSMTRSMLSGYIGQFFQGWLVLAVMILILDVLLGILQLVVADRVGKSHWLHSITPQSQSAQ